MSTAISAIQKANVLRKEFIEIEINHDELLSIDQFYMHLDKKMKKQFDRNFGDQLYQRMNKGFNNKITVDEFIKVFLQAEEILKNKIEGCKRQILEYNKQRKIVLNQFEVFIHFIQCINDNERVNQYGINENSQLTLELIEGVNFPAQNVQVILQLEDQKQEIKSFNGPTPKWNQTSSFKIQTGLEELQLFFYTINHPNQPQLLGTVTLSLSHLTNQTKVEDQCQLFDKNGRKTAATVHIRQQWLFNETKLLSQQIEAWNETLKTTEDDLLDYEKDLSTLYEPFPSYIQLISHIDQEELKINQQPPNTFVMTPINNQINYGDYQLYARLCILTIMGISIFICFAKSQYLDLLICFVFIIEFELKQLTRSKLIGYSVAIGFSLLFDLIWAIKYSRGFWGSDATEIDKYYSIERGPNRLALILIYISFIFKLIQSILFVALSQQYQAQESTDLPVKTKHPPIQNNKQTQYQKNKTAYFGEDNSTFYNY